MTPVWQPQSDAQGRTWIGKNDRQEWASIIIGVCVFLIGTVVFIAVQGRDGVEVAIFAAIAVPVTIAIFRLMMSSKSGRFGLLLSDQVLEIRQGIRITRVPWTEITAVTVERNPLRGGDVVVLETTKRIYLTAPIRARRFWTSWLGDPDFDAKVAHLRAHLPAAA